MKRLFLFSVIATIIIAITGGALDVKLINSGGHPQKILENIFEIFLIWLFISATFWAVYDRLFSWATVTLCISSIFLWWVVHDMTLGVGLGQGLDYIGAGKSDQWFGAIFQQSGWLYIIVRLIWYLLGVFTYFRLAKEV